MGWAAACELAQEDRREWRRPRAYAPRLLVSVSGKVLANVLLMRIRSHLLKF